MEAKARNRMVIIQKRPAKYLRQAFTLIELLVVIAIIAILAAMLLPSLQPSDTFMGAEIWSWHQPLAINDYNGATKKPIRVAYFCDGHAAVTSEASIQEQCKPPSAPGIGPVP